MTDCMVLAKKYINFERVDEHRQFIEQLLKNNDHKQLEQFVGKRLTFGTAGIRGCMGPGFSQMNDLVIIQSSQGLASYLLDQVGRKVCQEQGVVIGYDARHNSSRFARLTALAFLQKNIPVYFCDRIIPTPLVAFGVKHFSCVAGIVITASHNPKTDNGYKVYWSNGAQILSPHDKNIQFHIEQPENQKPWPKAWNHEWLDTTDPTSAQVSGVGSPPKEWEDLVRRVHADLSRSYFAYIEQLVGDKRDVNQSAGLCITYTTMHGVGHLFLPRALDIAGFEDSFPVELQKKPDPEFSTVKYPNPEEAGALDLAFETAKHANSNLILAVDPDVDRCAAALYDPKTGYKRVLNGNEIGALLGWWCWHNHLAKTGDACLHDYGLDSEELERSKKQEQSEPKSTGFQSSKKTSKDCYMISTAVSSKFLQSMAIHEGFQFVETLTGFKYMGNKAEELMKQGKRVLFAFEEAIGYMVDPQILDKDGISAAVQLAQCAAYVNSNFSKTLEGQLDWLYTKYGYHYSLNSYFICTDRQKINSIFYKLQTHYPKSFNKNEFTVKRVRDLNSGFDSGTPDKKPTLPVSTSSFMITLFIDDNITFTLRTSGTEPKIKYYSEIVVQLPSSETMSIPELEKSREKVKLEAQTKLARLVHAIVEECIRPDHYGLLAA